MNDERRRRAWLHLFWVVPVTFAGAFILTVLAWFTVYGLGFRPEDDSNYGWGWNTKTAQASVLLALAVGLIALGVAAVPRHTSVRRRWLVSTTVALITVAIMFPFAW